MKLISLFDKKSDIKISINNYQIKSNVKSRSNVAKQAIIVNDEIVITKNHKVTFICNKCGKEYSQMYQKCREKLLSEIPLCQFCSRSDAHVNPSQEDLSKRLKTKLEKYGKGNNIEKIQQTMLEKYGHINPFRLQSKKVKSTMLKRYGAENPQQVEKIHNKIQSKSNKKYGRKTISENLHYQSKPEKIFIDECLKHNLNIKDAKCFWYEFDGKKHRYFPDFMINNTIYEIKSNHHWWKEEVESGVAKLKKECVLKNGYEFILLFDDEIKNFVNKKYGEHQ